MYVPDTALAAGVQEEGLAPWSWHLMGDSGRILLEEGRLGHGQLCTLLSKEQIHSRRIYLSLLLSKSVLGSLIIVPS